MKPLIDREKRIARRDERRLRRTIRREIRYWTPVLINTAARYGLEHKLSRTNQPGLVDGLITGRKPREKLEVMEIRANEQAVYVRINPQRLPHRISVDDLAADEVINTLSIALQRKVDIHWTPKSGVWYIVNRDEATRRIPNLFSFKDAWEYLQEKGDKIPPLLFIAGVTENARLITVDLEQAPHVLISGTTGSGKSVTMNSIICTLLMRHTPQELRFYAFDYKGGVEFYDYRNVPHLEKLITRPEDTAETLSEVWGELVRRQKLLKGRAKNAQQYNMQESRKADGMPLPYIVVIVDELSELILAERMTGGKEIRIGLIRLMQQGRAMGIHFLLATQHPTTKIVDPSIKNNAPYRIAHNCATNAHSITAIDTAQAKGLSPAGRAIINRHGQNTEIQAPYISERQTKQIIKVVTERYAEGQADPIQFDRLELLRYGRDYMNGDLPLRQLYNRFGAGGLDVMNYDQIVAYIQSLHGQNIVLDNANYYVRVGAGPRATRLEPVEEAAQLAAD